MSLLCAVLRLSNQQDHFGNCCKRNPFNLHIFRWFTFNISALHNCYFNFHVADLNQNVASHWSQSTMWWHHVSSLLYFDTGKYWPYLFMCLETLVRFCFINMSSLFWINNSCYVKEKRELIAEILYGVWLTIRIQTVGAFSNSSGKLA